MTIDEVYREAEKEEIEIDEIRTNKIAAMSFPNGWVAIDRTKFESEAEFKTALAHEIGHIKTGSFYKDCTPFYTRAKCEYKANKKAVQMLIPYKELRAAFKHGIIELWQLAEHFGVTEQLMQRAYWLYEERIRKDSA